MRNYPNKFFSNIRLAKVAIKNLYRIHLRYFFLIKTHDIIKSKKHISKRDIFILTSCLNHDDNVTFHNHNPSHNLEMRLKETLNGIASIRKNFPNGYIIILDNSKIPNKESKLLLDAVDEYYDYSESSYIKISRKHFNKGVPQFSVLSKFCQENYKNYSAEFFHFMSARYNIVNKINNKISDPGTYMLYFEKSKNVSTRYYFFKNYSLSKISMAFKKTLLFAILGNSVEDALFMFVPNFKMLKKLEIKGMINGTQYIYE